MRPLSASVMSYSVQTSLPLHMVSKESPASKRELWIFLNLIFLRLSSTACDDAFLPLAIVAAIYLFLLSIIYLAFVTGAVSDPPDIIQCNTVYRAPLLPVYCLPSLETMPKFPGRYYFFGKARPPQERHFSPPLRHPYEGVVTRTKS